MKRTLALLIGIALSAGLAPQTGAAIPCAPGFLNTYTDEMTSVAHEEVFDVALAVLGRSTDAEFNQLMRTFTREVLDVFDNPSLPGVGFDQTLFPMMRTVEGLFAGRYTLEQFKSAFRAADGFRRNGVLLPGIAEKVPTAGSSSWITNVVNAGHLFEMAGVRNLTQGAGGVHVVVAGNLKGFGYRVLADGRTLEGDAVELIAGGERWIDLKGVNAVFDEDQLRAADAAIRARGQVKEVWFARETGASPGTAWEALRTSLNERLAADGFPIIELVSAGTL